MSETIAFWVRDAALAGNRGFRVQRNISKNPTPMPNLPYTFNIRGGAGVLTLQSGD